MVEEGRLGSSKKYNEMHHKPSKKAAALIQKDKSKFEEQIHARLEEVHLLELAAEASCNITAATNLSPSAPLLRSIRPVEGALLLIRTLTQSSYMQGIVVLTCVLKGYLQTHSVPAFGSLSTSY